MWDVAVAQKLQFLVGCRKGVGLFGIRLLEREIVEHGVATSQCA